MLLRTTVGAFISDSATAEALEAVREHRMFLRSNIIIEKGGVKAAAKYLGEHDSPPVLIVETEAKGDALYKELDALANVVEPTSRVFLIGRDNDIRLFRELIREGIADYLVGPVTAEMLLESFGETFEEEDAAKLGRTIAFYGSRGGAGASIIAAHVASALVETYEAQTVLLDSDINFGTAALVFNQQARQTIVDALAQLQQLDPVLLDRLMLEIGPKLSVLASPGSLGTGVNISPEAMGVLLKHVRTLADFVIIDLPKTWDPWVRDTIVEVDEMIVVSEPDLSNLRDAKNVIEFLGPNRGSDVATRLILNKVGAKKNELSAKEFRDALAMTPALEIPFDPAAFGLALNNGELIFKAAPKSKACDSFRELAKIVSDREAKEEEGEKKKKKFSLFKGK